MALENPDISEYEVIFDEDQLIYIRAYKSPDYGVTYSFRDAWMINKNLGVKFIGGFPSGRMMLNITDDDASSRKKIYYTEELLLPLDQLLSSATDVSKYDYHQLKSDCRALHYLSVVVNEPTYHLEYPEEQYMVKYREKTI